MEIEKLQAIQDSLNFNFNTRRQPVRLSLSTESANHSVVFFSHGQISF
jgi:hypothetical protein